MATSDYVTPRGRGCEIRVEAVPGSDRTEVAGFNEWRRAVRVKVAAEAEDDAANKELIRFLAGLVGVKGEDVKIASGRRTRHKVVYIDTPVDRAAKALERA